MLTDTSPELPRSTRCKHFFFIKHIYSYRTCPCCCKIIFRRSSQFYEIAWLRPSHAMSPCGLCWALWLWLNPKLELDLLVVLRSFDFAVGFQEVYDEQVQMRCRLYETKEHFGYIILSLVNDSVDRNHDFEHQESA